MKPPVLSALVALLLALGTAGAQQIAVFRTESRLVVLHVTVRNGRGTLVTHLGRDSFTVYEDSRAQTIALFRNDDVPVSMGLLIDNSGSMRTLRAKVEAAALACVRASNPDDEVFVLNFADKASIDVPLTGDMRVLEAGIARVDSIGGTAMRDAIEMGSRYLTERARRDRKVLLVVTDGRDNASLESLDDVRRRAERREIAIYSIGLAGHADGRRQLDELDKLSEATGGAAYFPRPEDDMALDSAASEIAREIRSQYTIAYSPGHGAPEGSYRKVRVAVKGSGLTATTRAGYRTP